MSTKPEEKSTVVAEPRQKADAREVIDLIQGAMNEAEGAGLYDSLELSHKTLRMLWEGQTEDGRLPKRSLLPKDQRVFLWEGAPDTRVPYAAEVVERHALIRNSVWNRGEIKLGPRETELGNGDGMEGGVEDEDKAASWQKVLEFYLDVDGASFGYQMRLFNYCIEEFGYGMMFVGCRRRARTAKRTVNLQDLLQVVANQIMEAKIKVWEAEAPGSTEQGLPPEVVQEIQAESQQALNALFLDSEEGDARLRELLLAFDPRMRKSEARWAAKELRAKVGEEQGAGAGLIEATYYAPQDDGYWPFVQALVPFVNGIHGMDLTGEGRCWWFAMPEILCEADVRARATAEEWDDDFLEKVLAQPNKFLTSDQGWQGRIPKWACSGVGIGQVLVDPSGRSDGEKFYQVVYVHREMVDKEGLPMAYETLIHPGVEDCVGFHECSGLGRLPLHVETREDVLYAVQSEGIPAMVAAGQNFMKDGFDAEGARSQLGSKPPLNRTVDQHVEIRPGAQVFQKRPDMGSSFMDVPKADQGTFQMLDRMRDMWEHRFFNHKETDPDLKRLYREGMALRTAMSIREVVRLVWKVLQGNVDVLKAGRIRGKAVNLDIGRDDLQGEVDITVSFNVDGLSVEASDKFMDWVVKLSQADRGGAVDWNEVMMIAARMSNPDMAGRIILPREEAVRRVADDQNNRIAQMGTGVAMSYEKKAAAPEFRLQVVLKWMQMPANQTRMAKDPAMKEQMEREVLYLQRQIQQYTENAVTGQTLMPEQ